MASSPSPSPLSVDEERISSILVLSGANGRFLRTNYRWNHTEETEPVNPSGYYPATGRVYIDGLLPPFTSGPSSLAGSFMVWGFIPSLGERTQNPPPQVVTDDAAKPKPAEPLDRVKSMVDKLQLGDKE